MVVKMDESTAELKVDMLNWMTVGRFVDDMVDETVVVLFVYLVACLVDWMELQKVVY
jgi:hypothetical protein